MDEKIEIDYFVGGGYSKIMWEFWNFRFPHSNVFKNWKKSRPPQASSNFFELLESS